MSLSVNRQEKNIAALAFRFVGIVGIINFFADFTYEGGKSIMGPFLGILGASASTIGFVAGFGEMIGYALRSFTGFLLVKPINTGLLPWLDIWSICSQCPPSHLLIIGL